MQAGPVWPRPYAVPIPFRHTFVRLRRGIAREQSHESHDSPGQRTAPRASPCVFGKLASANCANCANFSAARGGERGGRREVRRWEKFWGDRDPRAALRCHLPWAIIVSSLWDFPETLSKLRTNPGSPLAARLALPCRGFPLAHVPGWLRFSVMKAPGPKSKVQSPKSKVQGPKLFVNSDRNG